MPHYTTILAALTTVHTHLCWCRTTLASKRWLSWHGGYCCCSTKAGDYRIMCCIVGCFMIGIMSWKSMTIAGELILRSSVGNRWLLRMLFLSVECQLMGRCVGVKPILTLLISLQKWYQFCVGWAWRLRGYRRCPWSCEYARQWWCFLLCIDMSFVEEVLTLAPKSLVHKLPWVHPAQILQCLGQ